MIIRTFRNALFAVAFLHPAGCVCVEGVRACERACVRGVEVEGSVASSHVTSLSVLSSVQISLLWLQLLLCLRTASPLRRNQEPLHYRAEKHSRSAARASLPGDRDAEDRYVCDIRQI